MELFRFAGVELNPRSRELRVGGQVAELAPKPFDVLVLLLEHAGELVTTEEILESAWTGRIVYEGRIASAISTIRKTIGDHDQTVIVTVPKAGYRLVAPVERVVNNPTHLPSPELKSGAPVPGREQWHLKEILGVGGFGEVWLAEHEKTLKRRVFKFCNDRAHLPALKREVTLYRYLQQALGDRDEFVPILEWNFEQPPYFIESDYAGENLRLWAERRGGLAQVPMAERIELVAQVTLAIASAHSVGVLHKDIKPENILVSESGGARRVHLCDFGVGRIQDAARLGELGITQAGFTQTLVIDPRAGGTLLYMAPELLSGGVPSVQSDIFALGILLYQMMTGEFGKPMPHGWEDGVADELLRQDIADATHGARERRIASATILAERLQGLDARRADLQRHRAEQAQLSRARDAEERARLRRPWLIAVSVVFFAGLVVALYLAVKVRNEGIEALEEAHLAEAFNDFLSRDILHSTGSEIEESPDVTLKDTIVEALPLVPQSFASTPSAEASVDATLGRALLGLSDPEDALPLLQRAIGIYVREYGGSDLRTLNARIDAATGLSQLPGRWTEGQSLFRQTLPELEALLPPADPRLIRARVFEPLYFTCKDRQCPELPAVYERLIAEFEALPGAEGALADLKVSYAVVLKDRGRFADEERDARQWIAQMHGKSPKSQASGTVDEELYYHSILGEALGYEHQYRDAEAELQSAVRGLAKADGPDSYQETLAVQKLGNLYALENRWGEALTLQQQAYEAFTRNTNQQIAKAKVGEVMALVLIELGRSNEALGWARDAETIGNSLSKPQVSDGYKTDGAIRLRLLQARALIRLGRPQEAQPLADEIASTVVERHPTDPTWQRDLLDLQAELARSEGKDQQARDLARHAVEVALHAWGRDDPATRRAQATLQSISRS